MGYYTGEEELVLMAGMANGPERNAVWDRSRPTVERLGKRGLINFTERRGANGHLLVSVPLSLSPAGVREALRLQERQQATPTT